MTRHHRRILAAVALVLFLRLWTGDWVTTAVLGVSILVGVGTFCALLRLDRLDDHLAAQARNFNARQDAHHAHYDDRLAALERRLPPYGVAMVPGPRKGPTQ